MRPETGKLFCVGSLLTFRVDKPTNELQREMLAAREKWGERFGTGTANYAFFTDRLAFVSEKLGDWDSAVKYQQQLVDLIDSYKGHGDMFAQASAPIFARERLSTFLLQGDKLNEALAVSNAAWSRAKVFDGNHDEFYRFAIRVTRGTILRKSGDLRGAETCFHEATSQLKYLIPRLPEYKTKLVKEYTECLKQLGKSKEAAALLDREEFAE